MRSRTSVHTHTRLNAHVAEHAKINPLGETPAIKLSDGTLLSEAPAIARYLEGKHEGRKIMGSTPLEQGLDAMWDARIWTVRISCDSVIIS